MSVDRKEGKPGKFYFENVVSKAKEFTLKEGGHIPMLIVQGNAGNVAMGMEIPPEFHEERFNLMFAIGTEVAKKGMVGRLEEVFFVSEGWMSVVEKEKPTLPPSQDSKRMEVLQITGLEVTRGERAQIFLFEMVRDEKGDLIDLNEVEHLPSHKEGRTESPLLAAFLDGYRKSIIHQN